ncbi:MAG TPA: hypothetical protein VGR37_20820, partial [Longimicrobiaceae bacterium]|nr:hypothetical protein [Longimicrobiaceae bacterium]
VVARAVRQGGGVLVEALGDDDVALEHALPGLPALLLEREPRAVHLSDRGGGPPGAAITMPVGESLRESLAALQPFALDALTLDVDAATPADLEAARHASPLVAAHLRSGGAAHPDVRLALRREGDALMWTTIEAEDAAD